MLAGWIDSAPERLSYGRQSEAAPFEVSLGRGRGEYLERDSCLRGCYGQFILGIGVQPILEFGLERLRLSEAGARRHRKWDAVLNVEVGDAVKKEVGRGGSMGCPGGP